VILSTRVRRCYLALHRVDFRLGHDGLTAQLFQLGLDPFAGDLVIFIGRHKNRLKVIYADDTGLWLATKRFTETMKTRLRFLADPRCTEITQADLAMILEGAAYTVERRLAAYVHEADHDERH
jgi:hypothetical protein